MLSPGVVGSRVTARLRGIRRRPTAVKAPVEPLRAVSPEPDAREQRRYVVDLDDLVG